MIFSLGTVFHSNGIVNWLVCELYAVTLLFEINGNVS